MSETAESVLVRVRGGGGFEPRTIVAPAGEPLLLDFLRETDLVCAERLLFPAFGVDVLLPVGRVVRVELAAAAAGEYPFGCGFGTLRGRLIVR